MDNNWYPQASASTYTSLLQAAYPAIKLAAPNAKIISSGLSPTGIAPENFLIQMYQAGAQGHMDYVGYHPYSWPNSPDFTQGLPNFSELASLYSIMKAHGDGKKQIMATEVGWPTYSGGNTETDQATYIERVFQEIMQGKYQYVAIACIYDFLDDGTDANNPEDHFGLLRADYSQKPSYSIMQAQRAYYNTNFTPANP
jgi:exo-beta-1,3-glucanase (GH17 family)